jgi:DNA end-binding protein Ku
MGRALAKPIIQIGLVNIPIRLETLQRSHDISFNNVCSECKGSPVKLKWWCPKCSAEFLSSAGFLKGYYDKSESKLKVFSKEQISILSNENTKIEIMAVIPSGNIPFYFVEKTYSVMPEKKYEELFNLFYAVLNDYGYTIIGKYSLRGHQHIVAIIPYQERLFMSILYYPDEVNLPQELAKTQQNIKDNAELLAKILQKFEKASLTSIDIKDERTEAVIKLLEGGTILDDIPTPKPSSNIQELLKRSLEV